MQPNMGKMLKGIAELQKRVNEMQKELSAMVFEGNAGGNLVSVAVTGAGEVQSLKINPALMTEDAETIEDLVVAALNNANANKEKTSKEKLSGIAGGLLPLGIKLPGM